MRYSENETQFYKYAVNEIKKVQGSNNLLPAMLGENVIHFSTLSWIDFTGISHVRSFTIRIATPRYHLVK